MNIPDVFALDLKFKLVLKASAKLPTKRWVDIWRIEIYGTHKGNRM